MSIVGAVVRPMWLIMLDENAKGIGRWYSCHPLPYIAPEQFYQWTVTIGGAGATIVVSVLFIFCKSKILERGWSFFYYSWYLQYQ